MLPNFAADTRENLTSMTRYLTCALGALWLSLLAGCGSYDFTVNDKVVFSPKPLFTDYDIADAALDACIKQAIVDGQVTSAAQLASLNCSDAGIRDLSGLGVFTGLTRLKLSRNEIRNLMELRSLSSLEELYLDGNRVVDPVPLYELLSLRLVDLAENPSLQCPSSTAMLRARELTLPAHCR